MTLIFVSISSSVQFLHLYNLKIKHLTEKKILKSVALLYTKNKISEKERRKSFTFTIASKVIKCSGINLTKDVNDLYNKNKILLKEIKDDTSKWKHTLFLDQCCQNDYTTQGNLQIQCNPYQITNSIFHRTRAKKS